jgi:DNA-directed RNA polymerase specialized sigma subunit
MTHSLMQRSGPKPRSEPRVKDQIPSLLQAHPGISGSALARLLGVSRQHISKCLQDLDLLYFQQIRKCLALHNERQKRELTWTETLEARKKIKNVTLAARTKEILALDKSGYGQVRIAVTLGISTSTVCQTLLAEGRRKHKKRSDAK